MSQSQTAFKICDLFCGTGGFSISFENVSDRFKSVYANDMEPSSKAVYEANCHGNFVMKDLTSYTRQDIENVPDFDILTAGFSCQPFSLAGKKLGFEDERSDVFFKIVEFLAVKKPSIFILENVKNLLSHDEGRSFQKVMSALTENHPYHIKYSVLDTSKVSRVPHGRERVYIIGFLDRDAHDRFQFPVARPRSECRPIRDFMENQVATKYHYTDQSKIYDKIRDEIKDDISDTNTVYQYRRHYVRENKSNLVPTLTANMGTGGHNVPIVKHNGVIRKLTPRECFNFQGFPAEYRFPPRMSDAKLYKLAGNAISVSIVEKIAEELLKIL